MADRLPSLDGLRAAAIVFVVGSHLIITPQFQDLPHQALTKAIVSGDFGVHIFFVISGFLITTLLLGEESVAGKINLKDFYIRRIFRIFPAYYFYLFTVYMLDRFILDDLDIKSMLLPLTYTTGLFSTASTVGWTVGHSWTLSIEEQYYILYPFFLFFVVRRKEARKLFVCLLIALIPISRVFIYKFYAPTLMQSIFYRGDCILWGCLLAFYNKELCFYFRANQKFLNRLIIVFIVSNILLTAFSYNFMLGIITVPFTNTAQSLFACLLIIKYTLIPDEGNLVYKILNNSKVVFVGVLSYSIYLWQQVVLQQDSGGHLWRLFPLNFVVIFLLAYGSYILIEKPCLGLRKKIIKGPNQEEPEKLMAKP